MRMSISITAVLHADSLQPLQPPGTSPRRQSSCEHAETARPLQKPDLAFLSGTLTAAREGVRAGAESMHVHIHTDEGQGAGIADDILIGLLVPDASLERRPGQVQAVTVSQLPGTALGKVFRSLVALLGAPTGIRFSSVVLPPLLVQTPFFSLHASCRAL